MFQASAIWISSCTSCAITPRARYLRTLVHVPGGYDASSPPGGPARGEATDLLLGDLLYHAPDTLGPRARALSVAPDTRILELHEAQHPRIQRPADA